MRLRALSVGRPRSVEHNGAEVMTSIFKEPSQRRLTVGRLNIDGDQQSDLSVHGGLEKAVYAYPAEHYSFWTAELGVPSLSWGSFGENLTTEGLREADVFIGDRYRIGSAEFMVTQPRTPCFKLGIRFGRADMVKRFHQSGRSGFYLSVVTEGEIGAGDAIVLLHRDEDRLSVADIVQLIRSDAAPAEMERAARHPALSEYWRDYFRRRLEGSD